MATQVSLAIAKVLQDGKWHPTAYFVAKAGYLIRPEGAYRHYSLRKSEGTLVMKNVLNREEPNGFVSFLYKWSQRGHIQRRNVDSKTIEWKITDKKWLQMYLTEPFLPVRVSTKYLVTLLINLLTN